MSALIFAIAASGCASLSNLFFRKSSTNSESAYQFLFYYFLVSFAASFLLRPGQLLHAWNPAMLTLGCCAGLLNVLMMIITSRALQCTSAGITFTFQNAGSVFPNALLFLFFGASFGFVVTGYQIAGIFLILMGLFFGISQKEEELTKPAKWIKYAVGCFLMQTLILSIFQGRSLIFEGRIVDDSDVWFMVGFFGMALIFQSLLLFKHQQKGSLIGQKREFLFGMMSGIANALSTYLLLLATKWATPLEAGLIFPLFAVAVIILCNLWGYWLYEEKPKMKTIAFCSLGILVASKMGLSPG